MVERLIEQRWVTSSPRVMDERLDTLRRRADYLATKIDRAPSGSRNHDEQEHAALMWAIAELSGIGDDVRREKAEYVAVKASAARRATERAEEAERLNIQYRVKVAALKAEVYRLSRGEPVNTTEQERSKDSAEYPNKAAVVADEAAWCEAPSTIVAALCARCGCQYADLERQRTELAMECVLKGELLRGWQPRAIAPAPQEETRVCEHCGQPDPEEDHYDAWLDYCDGSDRDGWTCEAAPQEEQP